MKALADELAKPFGEYKLFRPYRDVRFSKDKTPYKDAPGHLVRRDVTLPARVGRGTVPRPPGYLVDLVTPGRTLSAGGSTTTIAGPQLQKAVAAVRRKGYEVGGEQLTRVPTGFDKEHERAELLRHKTLGRVLASCRHPTGSPPAQARAEITKCWRAMAPVVDWLDTHVGHD